MSAQCQQKQRTWQESRPPSPFDGAQDEGGGDQKPYAHIFTQTRSSRPSSPRRRGPTCVLARCRVVRRIMMMVAAARLSTLKQSYGSLQDILDPVLRRDDDGV